MEVEQSVFVLHSRPYRETSALVTFLSPDYGKFNGLVRGVRGGRKAATQKTALLQPFQQLTVLWRERPNTPSDLVSIHQVELSTLRFPLAGDASICGLYLNELLYRLLFTQVPVEPLYEHYQQALYQLLASKDRRDQAWSLRQFEYHLLNELGQGLICDLDMYQQPILADVLYHFYPENGAIKAEMDGIGTGIPIQGHCLLALADATFSEACLEQWKRLFRTILNQYLGSKPLMTRQLFR